MDIERLMEARDALLGLRPYLAEASLIMVLVGFYLYSRPARSRTLWIIVAIVVVGMAMLTSYNTSLGVVSYLLGYPQFATLCFGMAVFQAIVGLATFRLGDKIVAWAMRRKQK